MTSSIEDLTSPDVAGAIARNPVAVLPLGSVEQHGPHLPCGTDTMAARLVAEAVAERLDALLVPFGPYGVTPIHAGHPGTVSLSRPTFEALACDICEELIRLGVRALVLVNWHEGNTASLNAVATDLQDRHDVTFVVAQACYVAQRVYAESGGELTHGGGIETLAVLAHDPALLRLDRAGRPARPPGAEALDEMRRSREVYGFVTDVTEMADDGWYGDPGWATPDRAGGFAATVAAEVVRGVETVFAARGHPARTGDGRTA
ncbi:MAG: creatininase family protein [Streptomycetales bacterium]